MSLPIEEVLGELTSALEHASCVVLQAPTGAGKTTGVPPALLDASWLEDGQRIIVLEPRRIAARAAARRMASARGEAVGETVGYQVRFDRKSSKKTRILVVTEGIFVRMLQEDPFLEGIGAVIFDEFHERSLQNDVALAMTRKVQLEIREELRMIVMSATLATEEVAGYLEDCPVVTSEGRTYPVDIQHIPTADERPVLEQAATAVRRMQRDCEGDLLVFLPGVGEIRRLSSMLDDWATKADVALLSLYGDLSPGEQDAILLPGERQKVILSTNVAETSVTIEGVEGVIDTGLARRLRFDTGSGLNRLELVQISQSSAAQRAGRAGRMGPGRCLRLWTAAEHRQRPPQDAPEIRHVDLASTALELLAWGEKELLSFPWLEAPQASAIEEALALLRQLEAINADCVVTSLGQQMASLPVHPRLARLILAGVAYECVSDACLVAALLSERDPFRRSSRRDAKHDQAPVSLWERLYILKEHQRDKGAGGHMLQRGAVRFLWQAHKQLMRLAQKLKCESLKRPGSDAMERLTQACLLAFPDRVARRRHRESHRAVMADGRGVCLADDAIPLQSMLCICLQIDAGRRNDRADAVIRQMLEIDEAQLPGRLCEQRIEMLFDPEKQRVMAMERRYFGGLLLREKVTSINDAHGAAQVLAEAAAEALEQALHLKAPATAQWLARLHCVGSWMPELGLPVYQMHSASQDTEESADADAVDTSDVDVRSDERDDVDPLAGLKSILPMICAGRRSFEELRKAPLLDILKGNLTYQQQQLVEQHAPERIEVPSGSRIRLQYEVGKPPILAVRIQEMFGLADTPRVAGGRVPVLLHLLAPNMRPQQITQDLRSFWESTYLDVRKELRQRYPKHAWPEDPWNAPPERRPRRKRPA